MIDQLTKSYVKNLHDSFGWNETIVIDGFFNFSWATNDGAAFSFLAGVEWGQSFFTGLTIVALVLFFLYYMYIYKKNYRWLKIAMAFVVAGTVGNFIDRLAYNYVVDFISFIFGSYHFPVFNMADTFITVGVIMLIVHYLFIDNDAVFKKKKNG